MSGLRLLAATYRKIEFVKAGSDGPIIEKNFRCSAPEGLSQDPYIERCFCEWRTNQADRLVHDFAIFGRISDLQLLMAIFSANMPQIACWGKTNEHDGYKTSFTRDNIKPDDVP